MSDPTRALLDLEKRLAALEARERGGLARSRIYNSGDQSFSSGAATTIAFNSNYTNTPSTISSASGFTAPWAGVYLIGANVRWASNATGQRVLYIVVGGTIIAIASQNAVSGGPTDQAIATVYPLTAGATVILQGFQDSGGALSVLAGGNYSPEFWIVQV